jgi:hypothetical protein
MVIKEIKIRNFRSFIKTDIILNNLTIFVGFNDVGKSNILKALNLFFNKETDYEKPLDFDEDHCKFAPLRKKKAEEITIEIILNAPKTYKGSKDIRWTKVWRKSGLHSTTIVFADGTRFPKKSKLYSWLYNIRYTYIPAIRGSSYFQILLAKLHDTLAETIEEELRNAGNDFIDKIKSNTTGMRDEITKRMSITSQIRFPANLQTLFRTLDFATGDGDIDISLSNRGDGIKTRHIPAILKFISDQLNINRIKGSPNINMIWGYEEPENNLEMLTAFKLAEQFVEYSGEIQLLVTTHSPCFYSLTRNHPADTKLYKVIKYDRADGQVVPIEEPSLIDDDMGIMPLIAPYIETKINEITELKKDITQFKIKLANINSDVLFVEGEDDSRIFIKIIEIINPLKKLAVKYDGLGCSGVKNQLMAFSWVSGISQFQAVGVFDYDKSGTNEYSKLREEQVFIESSTHKRVKAVQYKIPNHLLNIKNQIHSFPCELEEMYPLIVWKIAEKKGWLIKRDIIELNSFVKLDSTTQTIDEKLKLLNFSEDEKLYILNKVQDKHKEKISKFIIQEHDPIMITKYLDPLINFFKKEVMPFFLNT